MAVLKWLQLIRIYQPKKVEHAICTLSLWTLKSTYYKVQRLKLISVLLGYFYNRKTICKHIQNCNKLSVRNFQMCSNRTFSYQSNLFLVRTIKFGIQVGNIQRSFCNKSFGISFASALHDVNGNGKCCVWISCLLH